ncbi:hypothetical protein [Streptomyces sp. Ac-502]|uniref:hypothetical protein n=1 Tax=Streptomyces sp. Ac-502 TaxID=3342801 RepID=UPI0038623851
MAARRPSEKDKEKTKDGTTAWSDWDDWDDFGERPEPGEWVDPLADPRPRTVSSPAVRCT